MADVGQSATIELVGLGALEPTAIKIPDRSVSALDITKLSDTEKQSLPGRIVDGGAVEGSLFVDDGETPTVGWQGVATVTYPIPSGMTSPRIDSYTGFIQKVGGHDIAPDGVMSYTVTFVVNSWSSHTDAA